MDELLERTYVAEREHFWFKGFRQFIAPLIDHALEGRTHPRVLDCGCGTGNNLMSLGRRADAYGFDITARALHFAHAIGRHRVARASITHIPFRTGFFDLATSFDVLQCLSEEQETLALHHLARVVKPGGALVLNVAALEILRGSHALLAEEVRRYTKPLLRQALERAGLRVERLTYTNFSLFPVMLLSRTWQRWSGVSGHEAMVREIGIPARAVNSLFTTILSLEARAARVIDMPVGSSLLCLARKPG